MNPEKICPLCGSLEVEADFNISFLDAADNGFIALNGWCNECNSSFDIEYTIIFTGFSNIKSQ
jgi:hypothetical protein